MVTEVASLRMVAAEYEDLKVRAAADASALADARAALSALEVCMLMCTAL